jgi:Uma2 family endonuclease
MTPGQATTSPLVHRYTLQEFFALDAPQGGGHYELIAGVLYMVPPPDGPHNMAAMRLNGVLSGYATAFPDRCTLFIPRTAIWTTSATYLEPDLFLVRTERLATMDPGRLTTADLVVEILSPGSAVYDRTAKADTYAALGVEELWLVDPAQRCIEQRLLCNGAWELAGMFSDENKVQARTLPGLVVVPAQVFETF